MWYLSLVMITGFEPALRPGEHCVHLRHQRSENSMHYAQFSCKCLIAVWLFLYSGVMSVISVMLHLSPATRIMIIIILSLFKANNDFR